MKVIKSILNEKKDIINAMNSTDALKTVDDGIFTMKGILIVEKEDGTIVGFIQTEDGTFYNTTSPTVRDCLDTILFVCTDEEIKEGIQVELVRKRSKNNREFMTLNLL